MINPHVLPVSARLRWHIEDVAGWNLLGFDYVAGRHADYTPGSPDLAKVIATIRRLGQIHCPTTYQSGTPTNGGLPTSTVPPTWSTFAATHCCTPTTIPSTS
jgi:hypothetical protein